MTLQLCFVLLFASATLGAKIPINQEILDVFGTPPSYRASALNTTTVQPVTPGQNENKVSPDYGDCYNDHQPSAAEFDEFDLAVTRRVAALSEVNFLLSPIGLKLAMVVLTEAATRFTQAELWSVLRLNYNKTADRTKFSSIIASMQSQSTNYDLNLGSRIYIESSVEPRQKFTAISQEFYKTGVEKLDFSNPLAAAGQINSWVSNLTKEKLHNLITEDDIRGSMVLVLTTLFFKGSWLHQFNPNETNVAQFYISPTLQKQVPFMNVMNKFFYAESATFDAKILRMPYLGNKFAMYLIVPNSLTGLPHVINSLSKLKIELLYLQEKTVDVTLPKFNLDYASHLNGVLKQLGIQQAFKDTASFPGLARHQLLSQRLKISKVLQRSGIEVNEQGSVGCPDSGTSDSDVSVVFDEDRVVAKEVIANRPFMFFIEDEANRELLFTGRVSDPLAGSATLTLV